MTINNRGLAGQPGLPYVDYRVYAGSDAFVDLTFLDRTGTLVLPATAVYQLDDLTNSQSMVQQTALVGLASTMTLQIPASVLVMKYPWQGSQICQLLVTFTALDSLTSTLFTANGLAIIELIAIQTPQNL